MKAIVMYASITGNNLEIAEYIVKHLKEKGIDATIDDMFFGDTSDASTADIVVIVPYTYDKGSIPSEMIDLYDDLATADWSDKKYAVIGSGDRFYGKDFGKAIDSFSEQIKKTGATQIGDTLKIHTRLDDEDKKNIDAIFEQI